MAGVVNGAAGNFVCLADDRSPNGFSAVVNIDLPGTFHVSIAALPHLRARGGSLINISATLPYLGTVGQAPGPTAGPEGVQRLTTAASREAAIAQCPLGRVAAIDDVANAALFLGSGAAAFINGVTLVVDGGLWLHSNRIAAALPTATQAPPRP